MPSTACTIPSSVLNSTARFSIERTGSGTNAPLRGIERIAQAVADEVDAEDDHDDRQAREDREPPLLRIRLPALDEVAERRRRRRDPEAEERERGLDQDRRRHREGRVDDDRPQRVRKDVTEHDPEVTRAGGLRSLDVLLLAQGEEDAANDAGDVRPEQSREDERDAPLAALAEERRGREQDREERQRQREVGEPHQDVVDPAAVIAGNGADEEPDDRRDDGHEDAD